MQRTRRGESRRAEEPGRVTTRKSDRSTEITVETEEILVVKGSRVAERRFCPECHQHVSMLAPEEAAGFAGVSTRTLYRWIEAGKVHFCEPEIGILRVCSGSLAALLESSSEKV
jgi:hypothetical protein